MSSRVHVLLKCSCPEACQIRRRYIELFQWIDHFSQAEACVQQVSIPMVSDFLSQQNNKLPHCLSEIMDLFMAGVDQSQTDWPNDLAEGPQDIVT